MNASMLTMFILKKNSRTVSYRMMIVVRLNSD